MLLEWADNSQSDTPQSVELKVLERLIGNWESDLPYKPAEWTPKELQTNRTYQGQWVLNGRLIMSTIKDSDGTESLFLWAYDPQVHKYKMWRFTSTGQITKSSGDWDGNSNTLITQSALNAELDFRMRVHLTDDNQDDWVGTVTNKMGKLFFHMDGQRKRRRQ
jgi:hypothetical protein